jgi:hypothetical protein
LELRAREREEDVVALKQLRDELAAELAVAERQVAKWLELDRAEALKEQAQRWHDETQREYQSAKKATDEWRERIAQLRAEVERARSSFFLGRSARVRKAEADVQHAEAGLERALRVAAASHANIARAERQLKDAEERAKGLSEECRELQARTTLLSSLETLEPRVAEVSQELDALENAASEEAKILLDDAFGVFATLTKLYTDRLLLADRRWDTVILDEASMALPPLVAYAATRAKRRMVIVGDMYQLPPIVRSNEGGPADILRRDAFALAGITQRVDARQPVAVLAKLETQRRMDPSISKAARHLIEAYDGLLDDPSVHERAIPAWIADVPIDEPLAIVDISVFRPWSGKVNTSRFNYVSANVAVELASQYAAGLPEPAEEDPPSIGIVSPYAAQSRYLNRLIQALRLERWVSAGTVHTFQGNECDVIIFDSVVAQPHWTARFSNPADFAAVRRDLNVAITRARHRFIFVGDGEWLRKYAKPQSGYGRLYGSIDARYDASDLLGPAFRDRIGLRDRTSAQGWSVEQAESAALFTEANFYEAFAEDVARAKARIVLFTPFIGKQRWPRVEQQIKSAARRGVQVFVLHKPLTDREWRQWDPAFGRAVFEELEEYGVHLLPISGVHAKTIVIDSSIVYEGSLNWASQIESYEHMWRFESKPMALLVERQQQLGPVLAAWDANEKPECPYCGGPLHLVNLATRLPNDPQSLKLACSNHSQKNGKCPKGYLRNVDARPPFKVPPTCPLGGEMTIQYTKNGYPWAWRCSHRGCKPIRWVKGDCLE